MWSLKINQFHFFKAYPSEQILFLIKSLDLVDLLLRYSYLQNRGVWGFVAVVQAASWALAAPSCRLRTLYEFHCLLEIMELVFG